MAYCPRQSPFVRLASMRPMETECALHISVSLRNPKKEKRPGKESYSWKGFHLVLAYFKPGRETSIEDPDTHCGRCLKMLTNLARDARRLWITCDH